MVGKRLLLKHHRDFLRVPINLCKKTSRRFAESVLEKSVSMEKYTLLIGRNQGQVVDKLIGVVQHRPEERLVVLDEPDTLRLTPEPLIELNSLN